MINGKKKLLSSPDVFKSRRTSLNVNLSYISDTNLSIEDDKNRNGERICERNFVTNVDNTVVERPQLHNRRNLSTRKKSLPGNRDSAKTFHLSTSKINPSFVRMVRVDTSTPIKSRVGRLTSRNQISTEIFTPSVNAKRSSVLEQVCFPLQGEIFSPTATLVMETSMDITEVQGAAILNSEPVVSERLNVCPVADKSNDSSVMLEDTESLRHDLDEGIERAVIPDSEQDSINTVRTSLHVNTSLDSRFSSMPNQSLYDPKIAREDELDKYINAHNGVRGVLPHPVSESSNENVPANSTIVTTAVIEREDLSNDRNCQERIDDQTTIHLESQSELEILHNLSLRDRIQLENNKSKNSYPPIVPNPSNIDSSNESSSTEASLCGRINDDEEEIAECNIPSNLAGKAIRKRKKRLLGLRRSEMVDLSPVAVQIVPKRQTVPKKRYKRNKAAKKILNKENEVAKENGTDALSEDDIEEIDPQPKKGKRIRKLKSKKIVIKKMADVNLWKRMNENANNDMNESCSNDISLALGRTSLDDFEPKNNITKRKNVKKKPKIIIVATGLSIEQKVLVKSTVTTLGSAKFEKIVTRNTTHIVSKGIRTVNFLRGIVRGCWLVSFEWISRSREAGEWVDPEKFEISNLTKAVKENRKEKQLFGAAYVSELFLTCGSIHIKEATSTPAQVLKELVRIAGGRVTESPEEAKIIIGRGGLKEVWILDSITNGKIQPLEQYSKKKNA